MNKEQNHYHFLSGYVQEKNICRVISLTNILVEKGSTWSNIMSLKNGKWYSHKIEWTATHIDGVTEPELNIVAIGPAGLALIITKNGVTEETIDNSNQGPKFRGHIRDIRYIGKHFYAVGMSRQVYRREDINKWTRQDDEVVAPLGDVAVSGFNAIDGTNEDNIYAVGFNGEIWHRDKKKWSQLESPTNFVLHMVKVIRTDLIFACGQNGVLLKSDGNTWASINQKVTTEDFWGIEWYKGTLYLSCDDGIFRLTDNDTLIKIKLKKGVTTYRNLHANAGLLWSFGPRHLMRTDDGENWNEVKMGN